MVEGRSCVERPLWSRRLMERFGSDTVVIGLSAEGMVLGWPVMGSLSYSFRADTLVAFLSSEGVVVAWRTMGWLTGVCGADTIVAFLPVEGTVLACWAMGWLMGCFGADTIVAFLSAQLVVLASWLVGWLTGCFGADTFFPFFTPDGLVLARPARRWLAGCFRAGAVDVIVSSKPSVSLDCSGAPAATEARTMSLTIEDMVSPQRRLANAFFCRCSRAISSCFHTGRRFNRPIDEADILALGSTDWRGVRRPRWALLVLTAGPVWEETRR